MSLSLFSHRWTRIFSSRFSKLGSFHKQIGLFGMFQTKAICKIITPYAPFHERSPRSTEYPEVNDAFDSVPILLIFLISFIPYTLC